MDKLDFQDLPYDAPSSKEPSAPPAEHTVHFSEFPPDATEDQDEQESRDKKSDQRPVHSIFSLAYYQQLFDVDTFDVGSRILSSMVPNPKKNYLEHVIRPNPDLYGPFWVCATLTFCIGITGNLADFFARSGENFKWTYNYNKVSLAATAIFSYWLIIPVVIWGVLRWRGSQAGYTLTELICVYGYSLAIYIPCSVLWLINYTWVQYLLAVLCSLLSGATLLITLWPAVKNDSKQVMLGFLTVVMILHALLATGFVLYFFKYDQALTTVAMNTSNVSSKEITRSVDLSKPVHNLPVDNKHTLVVNKPETQPVDNDSLSEHKVPESAENNQQANNQHDQNINISPNTNNKTNLLNTGPEKS